MAQSIRMAKAAGNMRGPLCIGKGKMRPACTGNACLAKGRRAKTVQTKKSRKGSFFIVAYYLALSTMAMPALAPMRSAPALIMAMASS